MTTWTTRTAAGLGATIAAIIGFGAVAQAAPPTPPPTASATADAQLAADLTFMREEERLARDLYAALASHYDGARPFSQITRSEQQHFDALGVLLARYGVADPSAGKSAGTYADAELQTLYNRLLAQGKTSYEEALKAGVAVEQADIADLNDAIARTDEADADQVFSRLLAGSQNHLAAFSRTPGTTTQAPGRGQGRQGDAAGAGQRGQGQGAPAHGVGRGQGQAQGLGRGPSQGQGTGDPATCPLR